MSQLRRKENAEYDQCEEDEIEIPVIIYAMKFYWFGRWIEPDFYKERADN